MRKCKDRNYLYWDTVAAIQGREIGDLTRTVEMGDKGGFERQFRNRLARREGI